MDKKILEQAMQIASESSNIDAIEPLVIPVLPVTDHYKMIYKNITMFLQHDKELQNKHECLKSAFEGLGVFGGQKKKIIKQRIEILESTMEAMRQQLVTWWTEYENCPISIKVSNTSVGEFVCFGYYECFKENLKSIQSKISWKVLAKTNDRALLISKCILDVIPYSYANDAWASSRLREWCQKLYASNFTNAERQYILTTNVRTPDNQYGTFTSDKIFCLSSTEIQKYMPNYRDRYTQLTDCAADRQSIAWECAKDEIPYGKRTDGWWTRSLSNDNGSAACVLDRFITRYMADSLGISITESRKICNGASKRCPMGIRPAMWVKLE